ncbi:tRNA(Ile)-lysidine synthase [Flavobacterium sp. CECT 9288]|uniref:tRNA lysidine(34) synthetase TilS n=1 Tax=Flavobacterium sp. CECT 9288 TaxID=2845819 RepID=UPI001E4AC1D0|nr:tRNA lysidine(34) synthetase TilS [Flavobacterium sp. CECT 9288]CAH0336194.1 tRNA(Ile)-lysidine synthase [Flavobacterium sp. CECT 9288]
MIQQIEKHIQQKLSFLLGKKVLLATSGGIDSMVMVHLFQQMGFNMAIAHCNFQLRGLESFEDQKFVQEYASNNNIPFFFTQFDTKAFAEDYKISTQVAARELRYSWFYEILEQEQYDYILTAHHADDALETFIINLSRGTGIEGLTGIPQQNDRVVRPLLAFSQDEITRYAQENNIKWREDSSNATDKYLRNKIRHQVIPLLKDINSNFLSSFLNTQTYLQEAQVMMEDAAIMIYQQVAKQENEIIYLDIRKLKQLPNYKSYLYQWLKEFEFKSWDDIYALVESQSGKFVLAPQYRLLKDRDYLILSPINFVNTNEEYFISENQREVNIPLNLTFCKVADISIATNTSIFVDADLLHYPLRLQKWSEGAVFHPFGMQGKSKKVSKFFKDEKLSLNEKEKTWLLYSDETIVWLVGLRPDERFKVTETTKNILKIELR